MKAVCYYGPGLAFGPDEVDTGLDILVLVQERNN
jgi:hypothetical protein